MRPLFSFLRVLLSYDTIPTDARRTRARIAHHARRKERTVDANQAATLINAIVSGLAALDAEKDADVFERLGLTDIEHIHEIAHVETPDQERRNTVSIGLETAQGPFEIELTCQTYELVYEEGPDSQYPGDGKFVRKDQFVLTDEMRQLLTEMDSFGRYVVAGLGIALWQHGDRDAPRSALVRVTVDPAVFWPLYKAGYIAFNPADNSHHITLQGHLALADANA